MKYGFPFIALLVLFSCKGPTEQTQSDQDIVNTEVRSYLFLADSVDMEAAITDTILVEDLDGMLNTVDDNLMRIQWDIDTLASMIDTLAYQNMEYQQRLYPESIEQKMASRNLDLARLQLKMAELQTKKAGFQQTKRVMLHLRRSQLKSVAGYEVSVSYQEGEEMVNLSLLMSTQFRIVD